MLRKVKFSGWLVSVFIVSLLMNFTVILPSNADVVDNNFYLISLISKSTTTQSFDPEKVRLGITPTGWSNSDDLTIDLEPPVPYTQILNEMEEADFVGCQNAPKFPEDITKLKQELDERNLTISEPWVGTYFTTDEGSNEEVYQKQLDELNKQIEFMDNFDSNIIVVAELGGAVHLDKQKDPLKDRPQFDDKKWTALTKGLDRLGEVAKDNGKVLCYHPHVGTGIMTLEEIDRLMAGTKSENVKLLLDTGHLYYGGEDPLVVAENYSDRIKHVHLKNIRQTKLDEAKETGESFLDAIVDGIFTVPGDTDGAIKFEPILEALNPDKYEGWLMVEAEQDPKTTMAYDPSMEPLDYAEMARKYLRETTGL